jgi:hypothetical protein
MRTGSSGAYARQSAHTAAQSAEESKTFRLLARSGFALLGLMHILMGAIGIAVAMDAGEGEADESGALGQLARTPGGDLVLWSLVIGVAALGLWQLAETVLVPGCDWKRRWSRRVNEFTKAISYFFIAALAVIFARGDSVSTGRSTRAFSETLLATPGGVILMAVLGLVVVIVGGAFVFRGASRRFTEDIIVPGGVMGFATVLLGAIGFVTKGMTLILVGTFFTVGAISYDASKATGLDGALKSLALLPSGPILPGLIGAGLVSYGAYFLIRAGVARM